MTLSPVASPTGSRHFELGSLTTNASSVVGHSLEDMIRALWLMQFDSTRQSAFYTMNQLSEGSRQERIGAIAGVGGLKRTLNQMPVSIALRFSSGLSTEVIPTEDRNLLLFVQEALRFQTRSAAQKRDEEDLAELDRLGWNPDHHQELKHQIELLIPRRQIVPFFLVENESLNVPYSWIDCVIDYGITPENAPYWLKTQLIPKSLFIPNDFRCPITTEVILHPVKTNCGHTFDKSAIEQALLTNPGCPCCRTEISTLEEAKKTQDAIREWLETFKVVTANIDVGFGNMLNVRGVPPLSWNENTPMVCVRSNQWMIALPQGTRFKFTLNNTWEVGGDRSISEKPLTVTPSFPYACR